MSEQTVAAGGGCEGCSCAGSCGSGGATADAAAAGSTAVLGTVTLEVLRYRPDRDGAPQLATYQVPYSTETSVVDALNWVKDTADSSLAFRWSCRMGICGSCGMMINGLPRLACETFVRDFASEGLRVEPLENFSVERDLVVDLEPFLERLTAVKPWIVPGEDAPDGSPGQEGYRQTPEQMLAYHDFAACMNCMLCYAACPQVNIAADFLGPAAIATAIRYDKDSRDCGEEGRMPVLDAENGIWPCTFVGACSTVCPKGVDPAAAIQQAKMAVSLSWAAEFVSPHKGAQEGRMT
ncbi:succinate dehydrogenase/fumarate reductase iron-sulfur subunit [Bogoriella caseilytica]|uniref:Fumarate reductase iron-sulfur subunit n=1 Tax=Bogoriella caseilytica TaxID=56055 RepID=A0A3N2B9N0_9MICO|nr:succinate dehydrogenase/fumarate reductase iron-sulfur subunit [Bogoriella caseilytica]ROR71970.1 succinate dehydrogenase subunit B [Bogoriella caseilytica]